MDSPEELIRKIDWELLVTQKRELVDMLAKIPEEFHDTIEGMLNLLDNIQDCAVDYLGVDELAVFPHRKTEL